MRKIVLLALLVAGLAAGCRTIGRWTHSDGGFSEVAPTVAAEMMLDSQQVVVLDIRSSDRYRGPEGHIAGALNAPFDSFTSADVQLKPAEDIAAVFVKAGVKPGDTVIGYCHIGQQATAMLFAARSLGYRVLLYDGSFEDWSTRDLPVDNPSKR